MRAPAFWLKTKPPRYALILSFFFRVIVAFRVWLYKVGIKKQYQLSVPVVIVGNIAVGGGGKTPIVIALAQFLAKKGWRVGILSRGYKSKAPLYPYTVTPLTSPETGGDEPLLLAQRTGCPVVIDPDRVRGGKYLISTHQVNLIVSDDGLQHYRLARDIEIAVLNSQHPIGNGALLPCGPLREPVKRLQSVDFILKGGSVFTELALPHYYSYHYKPTYFIHVITGKMFSLEDFYQKPVIALAGIAHPQAFFSTLEALGLILKEKYFFSDHYAFKAEEADVLARKDLPLLMTEKDAVKWKPFKVDAYYLCMDVVWDASFQRAFEAQLDNLGCQHVET